MAQDLHDKEPCFAGVVEDRLLEACLSKSCLQRNIDITAYLTDVFFNRKRMRSNNNPL